MAWRLEAARGALTRARARARVCGAQKLQGLWDEEVERCLGRNGTEPSLLRVLVRAHGREYAVGNALKLPQDVLLFAGPFLLQRLVVFLDPQLTADRDLRFQDGFLLCCGWGPCTAPNTTHQHLPTRQTLRRHAVPQISDGKAHGDLAVILRAWFVPPLTHSLTLARSLARSLSSPSSSLPLSPPGARALSRAFARFHFAGLFVAQLVQSVMLHQYFNKVFHVAMQVFVVVGVHVCRCT